MRPACAVAALLAAVPFARAEEEGGGEPEVASPAAKKGEAGPRHKVQAFLVPVDDDSRAPAGRIASSLEDELATTPGVDVVDIGKALTPALPKDVAAKIAEARKAVNEGNLLLV